MSATRKNYPASFKAKETLAGIEAGFSGKGERQVVDHEQQVKELHAKIGQLPVEQDFLLDASGRLGLGGVGK